MTEGWMERHQNAACRETWTIITIAVFTVSIVYIVYERTKPDATDYYSIMSWLLFYS
jgi:hypothetical protein